MAELKNHPYFHGINWDRVAERTFHAPFESNVFEIDHGIPMDPASLFNITLDGGVKETTRDRLNCELKEESSDSIGFHVFSSQLQITRLLPTNIEFELASLS